MAEYSSKEFWSNGILVENFGRKDYWSTGIFVEGKLVERIIGRPDNWSILSKSKQLLLAIAPTPLIIV